MKLKKLLTLALAGFIFFSGASTAKAAELDLAWYAKQNPDVVKVLGNSPEMLKLHYELCGRKEARMANSHDTEAQLRRLFSAKEYGKLYPDIQKAFGENTEAMFQHYMAFGLLEGRRPSEKVSKATASSLKVAVEKAMKDAGLTVAPGSAQLVQIITGEAAAANISNTAVQQAMTKVTSVVEKAVTNTVQEVTNPAPAPKSSGSSKNNQQQTRTVNLTVYTDVTVSSSEITQLNVSKKAEVPASGAVTGNKVTGSMKVGQEIAVDDNKNKIGSDYWYAIGVLKSDYKGNASDVKQWYWNDTQKKWVNASDNPHNISDRPADKYIFGLGTSITGDFPADGIEKYTAKVALAKVKDGQMDTTDPDIRYYEVDVRLLRGLSIKYYAAKADNSDNTKVGSKDGTVETLTYKEGNGTNKDNPFVFNEEVTVKESSLVGSTYWVLVDVIDGTEKKNATDIGTVTMPSVKDFDRYKYFTDDFKNGDGKKLVGLGDDGKGGEITFSVDGVWFKLKLKAKSSSS